ncbi:MAG: galactosyltransferase-related protein [Mycobacteriaceae bacterium]
MRIAVITIVAGRGTHLRLQRRGLTASTLRPDVHVVVRMGTAQRISPQPGLCTITTQVEVPATGLPLAEARNAGAGEALAGGADLLIFLDVDCIPSTGLIRRYAEAARSHPGALLAGPVAYLGPPPPGGYRLEHLDGVPHPARPVPPDGAVVPEPRTELFWSLSFALTAATWERVGGFHPGYTGYGAEDTDFALIAERADATLHWVGGALAHHQHHGPSGATAAHAPDIVRNARLFHRRHGWWPMEGWLLELQEDGWVDYDPDRGTCALVTPAPRTG